MGAVGGWWRHRQAGMRNTTAKIANAATRIAQQAQYEAAERAWHEQIEQQVHLEMALDEEDDKLARISMSNASGLVSNITANLTSLGTVVHYKISALRDSVRNPGLYELSVFLGCVLVLSCYFCCRCAAERPRREKDYVTLPLITIQSGLRR